MPGRILIVDDDENGRRAIGNMLSAADTPYSMCGSAREALRILSRLPIQTILSDVRLPHLDGIQLCERVTSNYPGVPVIMMATGGDVHAVVRSIRAGASGFFEKPVSPHRLFELVDRAQAKCKSCPPLLRLDEPPLENDLTELVGKSAIMEDLRASVQRFASSQLTAVIRGESGTGKEIIARALHRCSARGCGPFVAVNCAAIPAELLASELFGHVRGAFTSATGTRTGLFDEANNGTLFMDEIGSMPCDLQASLLRVLEDGVIRPVGATHGHHVDVRVVAATNRSLQEGVACGSFRADLLFRLSGLELHVPALRERDGDVRELALHFVEQFARQQGIVPRTFTVEALHALENYHWPGNVRELENAIEAAMAFADGPSITISDLPSTITSRTGAPVSAWSMRQTSLEDVERRHITRALTAAGGNKAEAARCLGIDRSTLYRKMKRLGLASLGGT